MWFISIIRQGAFMGIGTIMLPLFFEITLEYGNKSIDTKPQHT